MGNKWSRVILILLLTLALANISVSCGNGTDTDDYGYPPSPPRLHNVKVISDSEIDLVFESDDTTIGIRIERYSEADGEYLLIATVPAETTTYQDIGLRDHTSYSYRLQAYNSYGNSIYSGPRTGTTFYHGYSLCAAKNSWYSCHRAICGATSQNDLVDIASGTEVFGCFGQSLQTLKTMTVTFDYRAWADSCYNQPIFTARVGTQSASFNYSCQTSTMTEGAVSLAVPFGTTINDVSFDLTSGDWGAQVVIKSITFSP